MTQLRQRMIDEMTLRGFSPRTHESYLGAVIDIARHYKKPPDQLNVEEVRQYLYCIWSGSDTYRGAA
jgi:integrase/recombinase XerD